MKNNFTLPSFGSGSRASTPSTNSQTPVWLLFFSLFVSVLAVRAASLPANFAETRLATGLDPTSLEFAPDGRLFVTEKSGRVRIIRNGSLLPAPFLTLSVNNDNERGLQSLVFDPNFSANQYVYVYYTVSTNPIHNRVSRFTASGDVAVAGSETVLLDIDNLGAGNHNGGALFFSGGKLFITTGENAVPSNAQSMNTLLGKVLRINPDGSIPADNPFYNTATGQNRAIWALGFRNPFKATVQPGTGRIFINDVGQDTYEEVNELFAGKNYGWPGIEGFRSNQALPPNYQDPVYTYNHGTGCSITGGAFYNPSGGQFPGSFTGKYFFADYCSGFIKTLDVANGNAVAGFATGINRPIDVKVGPDGSLYYLARGGLGGGSVQDNTSSNQGEVWRVQYSGSNVPTISAQPVSQAASVGGAVTFTVGASGTGLSYQWQRNGANIAGATASSYTLSPVAQSDNTAVFRVIVSNSAGSVISNGATLTVNANQSPTARIASPANGNLYRAGDVISFAGSASDPEESNLPASAFKWLIVFHHDTHTHPGPTPTVASDGRSGRFTIPNEGETASNVWYRIYLTVTDAQGASSTVSVDVKPKLITLSVATNPAGLQVTVDGQPHTTPYSQNVVSGMLLSLAAPATQTLNGTNYAFANWTPGVGSGRITVPDVNTTYTANYTNTGSGVGIESGATYSIIAKHSGKALDVANGSTADRAKVHQWTYGGTSNQKWIVTSLNNGYYALKAVHSGKLLDVDNRSMADGADVQQWPGNGGDNQQFRLEDAGGGYYRIVARHSQKCIDVNNNSTADGAKVQQWTNNGGDNQKFRFTKLSSPGGREGLAESVEEDAERNLVVYPNPAVQTITVVGAKGGVVDLVDMLGTVQSTSVCTAERFGIDVSKLGAGMYVVQVKTSGRVISRKLVVSR